MKDVQCKSCWKIIPKKVLISQPDRIKTELCYLCEDHHKNKEND